MLQSNRKYAEPTRSDPMTTDANRDAGGGPPKKVGAVFTIRQGSHITKADAEILVPLLRQMAEESGGFTPEGLVERSRPATSRTHHLFNWNDALAAHQHRLHQARNYIGAIEVTVEGANDPVRAFPRIVSQGKSSYIPMVRVLTQQEHMDYLIGEARRELVAWTRRYEALRTLPTFKSVSVAVDRLVKATAPKPANKQTKQTKQTA